MSCGSVLRSMFLMETMKPHKADFKTGVSESTSWRRKASSMYSLTMCIALTSKFPNCSWLRWPYLSISCLRVLTAMSWLFLKNQPQSPRGGGEKASRRFSICLTTSCPRYPSWCKRLLICVSHSTSEVRPPSSSAIATASWAGISAAEADPSSMRARLSSVTSMCMDCESILRGSALRKTLTRDPQGSSSLNGDGRQQQQAAAGSSSSSSSSNSSSKTTARLGLRLSSLPWHT